MTFSRALYARRRVANGVFIVLLIAAALFGLVWLALILSSLADARFLAALVTNSVHSRSTPPLPDRSRAGC